MKKQLDKPKAVAAAALSIGVLASTFGAMPANAANGVEYSSDKRGWGVFTLGDTGYVGSEQVKETKASAYCIQYNVLTDYDYNGGKADKITKIDTTAARTLNYIIQKYDHDKNLHPEIAAAAHNLLDPTRDDMSSWINWGWQVENNPKTKALSDVADKWIKEAKDYIGEYKLAPKMTVIGHKGEVTNLSVKSSAGESIKVIGEDKVSITLTLTGPAVFDENSKKSITVAPGETPDFTATGSGEISVKAVTNESLPADFVTAYKYDDDKNQNKVVSGGTIAVSGSDSVEIAAPELGTTATDKSDGDKVLHYTGGTIADKIAYERLIPGKEYTVKGELMDKATGKGTGITASAKFTPKDASGTTTVEFKVPSGYADKTLVVFEYLYDGNSKVAQHTDINDVKQTVKVGPKPDLKTTLTDSLDGDKNLIQAGGKVIDTVQYTELIPGKEYTIAGELQDKATGKGTGIKGSTTFTPQAAKGSIDVLFDVPEGFGGTTLVAFEDLIFDGKSVVVHNDLNDKAQTIVVADIGTEALDAEDGDKNLVQAGGKVEDKVKYTNLVPGLEYTVKGELMDQATGEPTGVTGTATFTPETADGVVSVFFDLTDNEAGKTLVAFEDVLLGEIVIASHHDIEDEKQTVHVADIGTRAIDAEDGDGNLVQAGGTVTDLVAYNNLVPGKEYTVKGELMDKETGEGTGIKGEAVFTPEESNGVVEVEFKVNEDYPGKSLVAFEKVFDGEILIAAHEDIDDVDQTIVIADIGTIATDKSDGDKVLNHTGGTIVDEIQYTNLVPGEEYTAEAVVMDKTTGKSTGVTNTAKFIPESANGTTTVDLEIPAEHAGKELVVFEVVKDSEGNIVAIHKDIDSASQSFTVAQTPAPAQPVSINTGLGAADKDITAGVLIVGTGAVLLTAAGAALLRMKRRRTDS
ncbi:VaFE repeat-containing surface-anchored protein [Paeniglutamicibacter sp. NPDC091659]|uniref:VaFE repeat-containing surface-anchored protein n=1 Tax=Paeniglutamicibacter sp. NPDC091659 TaxID=3364389 RepID=UPI003825403D